MTTRDLLRRAEDALAEAEARLVWSAATCAAKCREKAEAYRSLDFGEAARAGTELDDEERRLADARIDVSEATRWRDSLRGRETAESETG